MIENNETEFKREFTDKIARTIVAFANTSGGSLYIGVDDDGTVVGIDDIDKVQLNVKNILRDAIRPDVSLYTAMNTEQRDGKWILRLDVGRGTSKPYYLTSHGLRSEGVYVRRGSSNEQASEQNIREMILSSMRLNTVVSSA
jgi:ATP-dependent DNA helicase RecG